MNICVTIYGGLVTGVWSDVEPAEPISVEVIDYDDIEHESGNDAVDAREAERAHEYPYELG